MAKTITALTLKKTKARTAAFYKSDTKIKGLQLRTAPDGSKSWSVRYRIGGTQKRLTIGDAAVIPLADDKEKEIKGARTIARAALNKVERGIDPAEEKKADKQAAERARRDSIESLSEAYIVRHARPHKRTWRDDQSKINCEILSRWKGRPVSSITRRDCRDLLQAIADRGAPIHANRIGALLSRLFRFALDEELITANPATRLPKLGVEFASRPDGEHAPKPYDDEEIRAIWQATAALDPADKAIYRLGLLTGQRPSEISGMEWRELEGSWWTIPGRRTKNGRDHRVFLVQAALDLLADVPRHDEKVFAGHRGKRQMAAVNAKVLAGVRRREKPRHAMRDTVATGLAKSGVHVEHVSRVLNHSVGLRVTAGYNAYAYDREKRSAMLKWARTLAAILEQKKPANVVKFAR